MKTPTPEDFAAKFRLALKALSLSRGQAAAAIGVDKSLVGRWASGAIRPSELNLARVTALVAARHPGFVMADWDRDLPGIAELLGLQDFVERGEADDGPLLLPRAFIDQTRQATARRGHAYEGFWRTTRPSVIMPGTMFHDHGMIRRSESGLLAARMGSAGLLFEGWMLPAEGNLFVLLYNADGATPLFLVFRGVPLPKASVLEGLLLLSALNAERTPAAVPIVLERIGDLSGDDQADDAFCDTLLARDSVADSATLPDRIAQYLIRDFGPAASAAGGDMFLIASSIAGLSRGTTPTGQLQG